jgi:hypothetical protein
MFFEYFQEKNTECHRQQQQSKRKRVFELWKLSLEYVQLKNIKCHCQQQQSKTKRVFELYNHYLLLFAFKMN